MVRIGIDCRFAGANTGLSRYVTQITCALLRHPAHWTLFVRDPSAAWIRQLPGKPRILSAPWGHYSFGEQLLFPWTLRRSRIDLLFVPHFNAPAICSVPVVITIHDLILHHYPNAASLGKRLAYGAVFRKAVSRARRIIAVSHFVSSEVAEIYGEMARQKTSVITEGVSTVFSPRSSGEVSAALQQIGVHAPYFLYVGNAKEHKNVQLLIDAFAQCGREDARLLLVTSGPEVTKLRLRTRVHLVGNIDDDILASLYCGAKALLTASAYEGYCLPVAEALACGCPVIASNRGAIPETAGKRATLVEPTVEDFSRAFLTDVPRREPYRVGSWDEAGTKTFSILLRTTES